MDLKFIGDHSSILGTIITPSGKQHAKMTKMGQKLVKLRENCVVFLYIFRIYSLQIFAGGGPVAP